MKPFKLIWTLRHGEALHNVTMNMNLHDPPLTTLGQLQALSVSAALCEIASQPEVARLLSELHSTPSQRAFPLDAVYVSPMKRTIHTAVLALGDSLSFDVSNCSADKIHGYLVPDLQEAGSWPSDVGSSLSILLGEFEALKGVSEKTREVHFPGEEWWLKTKDEAGPRALDERARRLRKWIAAREEKSVLLVSHGGFLGMLASGFWSTMGNIILRTMYSEFPYFPCFKELGLLTDVSYDRKLRDSVVQA
ncbi:histidine phosphatase superfamily [Cladochytrium replicatum]|nr:histidine phosphatase superfamily [Cladochytrium replicatum]